MMVLSSFSDLWALPAKFGHELAGDRSPTTLTRMDAEELEGSCLVEKWKVEQAIQAGPFRPAIHIVTFHSSS